MSLKSQLEENYVLLRSNKITDRKKACEKLRNFLDDSSVVKIINSGELITWDDLIENVEICMQKEAEKVDEEYRKKKNLNDKPTVACRDLFMQLLDTAVKKGSGPIDISNLVKYIDGCLRDVKMKRCYLSTFLVSIEYILANSKCRAQLESFHWQALLEIGKTLVDMLTSDNSIKFKWFLLLIKYGPLSGLPPNILREQFDLVSRLCQKITLSFPRLQQEDIIEIALEFCTHTAEDNRISCCLFGETVFATILDLYEPNGYETRIKVLMVEFFLLQVAIHHPGGAFEGTANAYAVNWSNWNMCLKRIYKLLCSEIDLYLRHREKTTSFFITRGKRNVIIDSFVELFVEVSRQLMHSNESSFSLSLSCTSQPSKKLKIEVNLNSYILKIQELKSWVWIKLISAMLESYPDMFDEVSYLKLFQTLLEVQVDCKDTNMMNNLYVCQSIMLDVQGSIDIIDRTDEIERLWNLVGEAALRALGLNLNIEAAQNLLQKLISKRIIRDFLSILKTYSSGMVNFTSSRIKTLEVVLEQSFVHLQSEEKETLIKNILNVQNLKSPEYLSSQSTANILVGLVLKQWPGKIAEKSKKETPRTLKKIKDIYLITNFERDVLPVKNQNQEQVLRSFTYDSKLLDFLLEKVANFTSEILNESLDKLICILVLLSNLLHFMLEYCVLDIKDIKDSILCNLFQNVFNCDTFLKHFNECLTHDERLLKSFQKNLNCLNILFCQERHDLVSEVIKDYFPLDLLKSLFNLLEFHQQGGDHLDIGLNVKVALMKTLTNFCCLSGNSEINVNQRHILEVLSQPDYDYHSDVDYKLSITFLNDISRLKPGHIPDDILGNILEGLQQICKIRYSCYEDAASILECLREFYPHVIKSVNEKLKSAAVSLLFPFYNFREKYGPEVSILILSCINQICLLDSGCKFSLWEGERIVKKLPIFLCSDWQAVRFKAVQTLITFFETISSSKELRDMHLQEEIFNDMFEKSIEVFNVTGDITEQRRMDETMCRIASVIHTFTALMLSCDNWIEASILALMKLEYKKNLGTTEKVASLLEKKVAIKKRKHSIEKYMEDVISKWTQEGYDMNNFQFKLFGCKNKNEFYMKYFDICAPLLVEIDRNSLLSIAQVKGLSEKDVLKFSATKIFVRTLSDNIENIGPDFLQNNQTMLYLDKSLEGDSFRTILIDNLDDLFIYLLQFVTDENYMFENFSEGVIFMTKRLSFNQFLTALKFIETLLCDGKDIIMFLVENQLHHLERILLGLKLKIHVAVGDDKLKCFQRYTVFVNMLIQDLRNGSNWCQYFIRDTIYFLIYLIQNNVQISKIGISVCKYLRIFLQKILPVFSEIVGNFLIFIVSSLKNICATNQIYLEYCLNILNYLIVENVIHLRYAIEKLDAFPPTPEFDSIRSVHHKLKYGQKEVSLEQEIQCFLDYKEISSRHDSLVHLRSILVSKREELNQWLLQLKTNNMFSKNCENNLLHRLIISLVKMSRSADTVVSYEAVMCLGEIGPANLRTLVLQPEKEVLDVNCTAFQLFSGHIVSLLNCYIIDADINVVKAASDAFHLVLNCKDGRKIAESRIDFGYGCVDMKYIAPFVMQKTPAASNFSLKNGNLKDIIDIDNVWCPNATITHNDWAVNLVTTLLKLFNKECYIPSLVPLCHAKPKFCERILPLVIYLLLHMKQMIVVNVLFEKINLFFKKHWELTIKQVSDENVTVLNKKSVKTMLNVVNFTRQQKSYSKGKLPELKYNYLWIAKAAEFCGAHFTAILYIELWGQSRIEHINLDFAAPSNTMIDTICEKEDYEIGQNLQKILRHAYKAIGEDAALPGCGISYLLQPELRMEYYKETGQWNKVMCLYEAQLSCTREDIKQDLFNSYKKNGLYQLPLLYASEEIQYECLWRLGQWDFNKKTKKNISDFSTSNFEQHRFYLLKAVCENDTYSYTETFDAARVCIIDVLKHTSLESSNNLYPILGQLQSLVEIENVSKCSNFEHVLDVLKKWTQQDEIIKMNDFQYVEPIFSQRISILSEYVNVNKGLDARRLLANMMLDFADYAKEEGYIRIATNVIIKLQNLEIDDDIRAEIKFREAQLLWASNDKVIAKLILNAMTSNERINLRLRSTSLTLLSQYMIESYSDSRMIIMNNLFNAVKLIADINQKTSQDHNSILHTYNIIASFADKEYQQISMHMKSDLFLKKISNMQKFREIVKTINKKSKKSVTIDEHKAAKIHQKQSNIDEIEIENTKKEKDDFLLFALKYYLKNLIHSDSNNIKIFRVISLFLENKDTVAITDVINKYIPQISSYKYIPILPQIIPHISENSNDLFSIHTNQIVEKCAEEHPHHTLPLLLSLANSYKDKEFTASSTTLTTNDSRIVTATKMIKKFQKHNKLNNLISKLQFLSTAIIELAYMEEAENLNNEEKQKSHTIPARMKIHKIKNYDDILCPTVTLPVSKNNTYNELIGIAKYSREYKVVGGINHPAQITCYGTDGKPRPQLAKGQDDLRQDAVMQQVFTIMNDLLAASKSTENLLIRTYKVVPMSMRSGLLEWVEETAPIGEYLIEAHQRYRPQDKRPSACRSLYQKSATKPLDEKLRIFKEICTEFKPVMHHFFEKSFPQPTVWYKRRRAYIHSVATTSMCGYILGIGDRHISNILLDTQTGELVHIDFGIAFEQGRCLPTPETVPFRLTRDIVDGMGISGVEGIFRSSCEKTMEILRQNSQTIMAILEVLLYDPLYAWAVSTAEANKRQTDNSEIDISTYAEEENTNVTAERALLRLHGKLHGTEGGNPTTIEHQVGTLIQQAMDPSNLCRLYHGWQPYM